MALREIDESELLAHQQVTQVVNGILAKPEARKLLLQARKIADPNAVIPELDAQAPVQSELAAFRKELAEEREARAKERREAEEQRRIDEFQTGWRAQKKALRDEGWSDEGISAVEKHAQEKGIADLEVAAAHYEKLHPPAEVARPGGLFGMMAEVDQPSDDAFMKAMIESKGDDESALNKEIGAAIRDFRTQTGAPRRY